MDYLIKNLPILVVITPLMFSLIVAILPNERHSWFLTNVSLLLTLLFTILMGIEISDKNFISYHLGNWPPIGDRICD